MVENGLAALARPKAARRNMGRRVRIGRRRQGPRQRKVNKVRGLVVVCRQSATADANQSPATLNVSAGPRPVEWPIRQRPSAPIPVKPAAREVGRKRHLRRGVSPRSPRNFNQNPCPRKAPARHAAALPSTEWERVFARRHPVPGGSTIQHGKPDLLTAFFGQRSRTRSGLGISRPTCVRFRPLVPP